MTADNAKNTSVPVDLLIATRPSSAELIPGLLEEITKGVNHLAAGNEEDRKDVLIKCRALARAIETPRETMVDHCWGQVYALQSYQLNGITDIIDGCNRGYRVRGGLGIMGVDGSEWRPTPEGYRFGREPWGRSPTSQ